MDTQGKIAGEALTIGIANWITAKLPDSAIPATVNIYVVNRDEIRSRPCIVIDAPESKAMPLPPHTSAIRLDLHLFSQIDDTPAATHAAWTRALADMMKDKAGLKAALNGETFVLHALMLRDGFTSPDETRGRESVITYEAIVSAV